MRLSVVSGLFAVMLLLAPLFLAQLNFAVADEPGVYILSSGEIIGTNNIVRDGNVYTLTGNVAGSLTVQKDNITIEGAGYRVQGGNRGIVLENRSGVTIRNTLITAWGGYTIDLRNAKNCVISQNELLGNPDDSPSLQPIGIITGPIAINFLFTQNVTIKNNNITNFSSAMSLDWSSDNTITGNNMTNGRTALYFTNSTGGFFRNNHITNCSGIYIQSYSNYRYENDLDESNTVDGKPIIYWQNREGGGVPTDAAYVALVNCSNVLVQDVASSVLLGYCTNCTVANVTGSERNSGITLQNCTAIQVINCHQQQQALVLGGSYENTISGCTFLNCSRAIRLDTSDNNVISGNTFTGNGNDYAIYSSGDYYSNGNLIVGNTFSNSDFGVSARGTMQIVNNTFVGNNVAILCDTGATIITGNLFENNQRAVSLQSTNNVLRGNQFVGNQKSVYIANARFDNTIDSSNLLEGKPMYYWVEQHDQTVPTDAGYVALVNCTGIVAQNLTLANQVDGIILAFSSNCTVQGNQIANNTNGIYLYASPNNQFTENAITNNSYAIFIHGATIATFIGYTSYTASSGNHFFLNNFINNNESLYDIGGAYAIGGALPSVNVWDNGTRGNYWSNYGGADANGDGVGDTHYVVYANNNDNYPLMAPLDVAIPEFPFPTLLLAFLAAGVLIVLATRIRNNPSREEQK